MPRPGKKTVEVDKEVWRWLDDYKKDHNLKNVNQVISYLKEEYIKNHGDPRDDEE